MTSQVVLQIVNEVEHEGAVGGAGGLYDDNAASISSKPTLSIFGPRSDINSVMKSDNLKGSVQINRKLTQKSAAIDQYNRQIVLNPYETIFTLRQQRYKMYYLLYLFGILASILQVIWTGVLFAQSKSVFTMGIYLVIVISLFHLCFFLIKKCIFDRGFTPKSRSISIAWCCCLKVSDPYDIDVFVNSARTKNRKMRQRLKELS